MAAYQQAPRDKDGLEWTTGLCDCFSDCNSCCWGFWCPCVLYGQNVTKLTGEDCFCPCLTFYALQAFVGCSCCISGPTRKQIRAKYQLRNAPCNDMLLHCCCTSCALCQETRELDYQRSKSPTGAVYAAPHGQQMHKGNEPQAYTSTVPQTYPANQTYPSAQPQQYVSNQPQSYTSNQPQQYATYPPQGKI